MEAESDNIFCDATEIVTAGADSDHGSDHGACLWSGYLFSKINIYQGQQHQP